MIDAALCADISARLAAAASSANSEAIAALFTEDATIWHNITGRSHSVGEAAAMFTAMVETMSGLRYEDILHRIISPSSHSTQLSCESSKVLMTPRA